MTSPEAPDVPDASTVAPPAEEPTSKTSARAALLRRPNAAGLGVALVFWWFSLVPTLMPRAWTVQAATSALCLTIGYALGTLGRWAVHRSLGRHVVLPARALPVGAAIAGTTVVIGSILWLRWQNLQRDLLAMEHLGVAVVLPMLLVTVVLSAVLFLIGRLVGGAVRRLGRWNQRHLPDPVAIPVTVVLVLVIATFLLRDVAFEQFTRWADASFSVVDDGTNEGTEQPTTATVSGGPGSLVEWDELGVQGRDFVAQATPEEQLREFAGPGAEVEEPVRVYAGLRSADDARARAELVVAELERTGGFDREVLVVATSTGTGWIDPDAAHAIELMHAGDTAIASMQYSFLPSWISFITDLDRASEAGAELYAAVHEAWLELPEDDRPRLISFGLSLGSFGAEAAFAGETASTSLANLTGRSDGALFVGATYNNPILRQLVDARDDGSTAWAPIVDEGAEVRFETRDPDQPRPPEGAPWDAPRVLYVQHPSDPVTHWDYSWLWRPPEWLDAPRGYDVPKRPGWFPIVTGIQGVFDLMAGFAAPPGHGHDYRLDYPAAWAAVAAPEGWDDERTAALEDYTAELRAAGDEAGS